MTGSALLTLIATILTAEAGVVEIDLGSKVGLKPGDRGVVFYEVELADQVQSVEIGPASVIETSSFTSKLSVADDLAVRPGFLVRFDLGEDPPDERSVSQLEAASIPETANRSVVLSEADRTDGASIAYVAGTGGACLKVRSLPTTASPDSGCLAEGTAVAVVGEVPEWSKALIDGGGKGWLASRFLSDRRPVSRVAAPPRTRAQEPAIVKDEAETPPATTPTVFDSAARPALERPAALVDSIDAEALLEELERAESLVRDQINELASSQDAVLEAHEARAELARRLLEATVEEYESELASREDRLRNAEQGQAELAAQYERLEADLATADTEFERLDAERKQLVAQLEETNSELAEIEAIATAAKEALRREIRATETALGALRSRLEQRESKLAETEARLTAVEAEREALLATAGERETAASDSRREVEELQGALAEARREKEDLEVWLEERGDELARAEARVAIMQSEIDRLEAMGPRNRQEIENTRAALADASRRAADLEILLTASNEQKRELEKKLAAVRGKAAPPPASASGKARKPLAETPAPPAPDFDSGLGAVVLGSAAPCLNFRAEPKVESQAFDCLPPGTRLSPLGHWRDWHYVELTDGRAGWVASRHLGPPGAGGSGP